MMPIERLKVKLVLCHPVAELYVRGGSLSPVVFAEGGLEMSLGPFDGVVALQVDAGALLEVVAVAVVKLNPCLALFVEFDWEGGDACHIGIGACGHGDDDFCAVAPVGALVFLETKGGQPLGESLLCLRFYGICSHQQHCQQARQHRQ